MPVIRTVFQPDVTREVHADEAAQLERERLLLPAEPDPAPAPAATQAARPAAPTTSAKEAAGDGDKQAR